MHVKNRSKYPAVRSLFPQPWLHKRRKGLNKWAEELWITALTTKLSRSKTRDTQLHSSKAYKQRTFIQRWYTIWGSPQWNTSFSYNNIFIFMVPNTFGDLKFWTWYFATLGQWPYSTIATKILTSYHIQTRYQIDWECD